MRNSFAGMLVAVLGTVLAGLGCSSSKDDPAPATGGPDAASDVVEVFSWWVAPGEADALQALVNTYKATYPSGRV
jgi:ABC-type glycerol-3-phosphate transport system substrate-binding protein